MEAWLQLLLAGGVGAVASAVTSFLRARAQNRLDDATASTVVPDAAVTRASQVTEDALKVAQAAADHADRLQARLELAEARIDELQTEVSALAHVAEENARLRKEVQDLRLRLSAYENVGQ